MQLYKKRGYEANVEWDQNKDFLRRLGGFGKASRAPRHPWGYPSDFHNLTQPDYEKNKVAWNLELFLPNIGHRHTLWEELIDVNLDATPLISKPAFDEALKFIGDLPKPIICLHTQGKSWSDRKNIPTERIIPLQKQLVERGYSVVILDWEGRTPQLSHDNVKNITTWGKICLERLAALYNYCDLLIGIDSGPLHFTKFCRIPALGVWRSLQPNRCSLPNPRAVNLVSDENYHHWHAREYLWNLDYYSGTEPTEQGIAEVAERIITCTPRPSIQVGEYLYRRVGHDERLIELLPNNKVGTGEGGCERYWLYLNGSLNIYGDSSSCSGLTCRLYWSQGKWVGHWLKHEKMPIELIPFPVAVGVRKTTPTFNLLAKDTPNIGDLWASPLKYFDIPNCKTLHLPDLAKLDNDYLYIVGGGGILHTSWIKYVSSLRKAIAWSIGHNFHDTSKIEYQPWLDHYLLTGVRDYGHRYDYLPCVSCMHEAFNKEYKAIHDIVCYCHYERNISLPIPTMDNSGDSFEEKIEFLGSGKTIVTNSYHGVYWSMLLNRQVIIVPWSSKFYGFKHKPSYVGEEIIPQNYDGYLAECRELNRQFYQKVLNLI